MDKRFFLKSCATLGTLAAINPMYTFAGSTEQFISKRPPFVVVKLNWPRFYSLASTFSLTRLVSKRHYIDVA